MIHCDIAIIIILSYVSATVVAINKRTNRALVHFDGFSNDNNEWHVMGSKVVRYRPNFVLNVNDMVVCDIVYSFIMFVWLFIVKE
jgi:hypothetical protein